MSKQTSPPELTRWTVDEGELVCRMAMETIKDAENLVLWDRELKRRHNKEVAALQKKINAQKEDYCNISVSLTKAVCELQELKRQLADSVPKAKVQEIVDRINQDILDNTKTMKIALPKAVERLENYISGLRIAKHKIEELLGSEQQEAQ